MCVEQEPGNPASKPGAPGYRSWWLEQRHKQMTARIAEMNHWMNLANNRARKAEASEAALRRVLEAHHVRLPDGTHIQRCEPEECFLCGLVEGGV